MFDYAVTGGCFCVLRQMDPFEGIDVNAKDGLGYTALHKCSLIGNWEVVSQLIDAGGDPLIRDNEGHDAAWFAHLHFKSARAMAQREFQKAGVLLNPAPMDLACMTDAAAQKMGKAIYEKTIMAAGGRIDQ